MSDPLNRESMPDDLFRNRIAAALRELDQPESDADIAAALDAIEVEPLNETAIDRVLRQARASIAAASERANQKSSPQPSSNHYSSRLQSGSQSSSVTEHRTSSKSPIVVACLILTIVMAAMTFQVRSPHRAPLAIRNRPTPNPQPGELLAMNTRASGPSNALPNHTDDTNATERLKPGDTLTTGPRQKRRVTLPDGSVLSINERSHVTIVGDRRVRVSAGEVFVEVVPQVATRPDGTHVGSERFVVETPQRSVTALGTKFVVKADDEATNVVVTQGKVQVSGVDEVVPAGYELVADRKESKGIELRPARRSSYVVDWVKDLMAATGSIVVPTSEHTGGTVIVVDPQGQEMKLSLRKFHVDVYIDDGFARTTIDQTYFNHTWQQLEGTFRFPLPADASLSRLAMYVNGTLMEGGMVERDYGRNVFEQIRHTRRDPALLEWVDGSTFQMRVFPLEARQEKRILLSYTQRLPGDYGQTVYRFPAGHNLDGVREWSTQLRVKGASGTKWYSPSHLLSARDDQGDLLIEGRESYAELNRDLVVEFGDRSKPLSQASDANWSVCDQDGFQYVMLRQRPELKATAERTARHWIFLVENSADRNKVLAETARQIVATFLDNVEHTDTFSMIRAGTQSELLRRKPVVCSPDNISAAQEFLREVAPIGALDLEQALEAAQTQSTSPREVWIVHLGSGIPVLGERDETALQRLLPPTARYVGVAIGKRWSKSFMLTAAHRTGGHVTQINPDEEVTWRAFDLLSTLNAPRLTEIAVDTDDADGATTQDVGKNANSIEFLLLTNNLAHGQELAAVTRVAAGQSLPKSLTITGKLTGKSYSNTVAVPSSLSEPRSNRDTVPSSQTRSSHLPRTWARLEIDRLTALGKDEHKSQIIELSKSMYVMSPFTSLLVLETEAMYTQFNVDRGRKDHWAMYPAPAQIPVVADYGVASTSPLDAAKERLQGAQARAQAAESSYKRSIEDNRPATDIRRLERLKRAEQAEVQLIEREVQRIEQAIVAAANPQNVAWNSTIYRHPAWHSHELDHSRDPLLRLLLRYNAEQSGWGLGNHNSKGSPVLYNDFYLINDNTRPFITPWPADLRLGTFWGDYDYDRDGIPNANTINGVDSNGDGNLDFAYSRFDGSYFNRTFDPGVDFNGDWSEQQSGNRIPTLPWYTQWPEEVYEREERYDKQPILDPISVLINPRANGWASASNLGLARNKVLPQRRDSRALPIAHYLDDDVEYFPVEWQRLAYASPVNRGRYFGRTAIPRITREDDNRRLRRFRTPGKMNLNVLQDSESMYLQIHEVELEGLAFNRVVSGNLPSLVTSGDVTSLSFALTPNHLFDFALEQVIVGTDSRLTNSVLWDSRHSLLLSKSSPTISGSDGFYYRLSESSPAYKFPLAGLIHDLPSYAPGLQTWRADRLAFVEQTAASRPKSGEVDAEAKRLIEKARACSWEKVSRRVNPNGPRSARSSDVVVADGAGRFVLRREVGEGLKEIIIQDGTSIWHLYPDFGLGAKRSLSRFHQSAIQSLVPWYVPPVEDLSVDADIKAIGERTIRITSVQSRTQEDKQTPVEGREIPEQHPIGYELAFTADGSLCESRITDITTNNLLAKQTVDADGMVRVFDEAGKLVAEARYERLPTDPPDLVPATKDLVVLPLPYRSSESAPVNVPMNLQTNAPDYERLTDDEALILLATYFAEARSPELAAFIEQRFTRRGDHRIGLAVLLSSVEPLNPLVLNATSQHPNNPLAVFLEQFGRILRDGQLTVRNEAPNTASPILQRIWNGCVHYERWAFDRVVDRERPQADIEQDLAATLAFIRGYRSPDLASNLLTTIQESLKRAERMNATFARQLNEATSAMAAEHGLPGFVRTSRIEWLMMIGDDESVAQAKGLLRAHLAESFALKGLPDLNVKTHEAFVNHFRTAKGQPCAEWVDLVRQAVRQMAEAHRHFALIEVARRCRALHEPALASEVIALAIKDQDLNAKPLLNLAALAYSREAEAWELAEACVQRALAIEKLKKAPNLWRAAAEVAHHRSKFERWIEYLDRASELEFAELPKTVDLVSFRQQYAMLFDQFDERTRQLESWDKSDKLAFVHSVQRAASRWCEIDVDDTIPCHRTAKILTRLGFAAAAWNYWTTPLAETPDQSTVWQTFADAMQLEQKFVIADQAWSTAFGCEPTNPEILLKHAQFLWSTRQYYRSDELLTRITTSTWQPRFDSVKAQAQTLLQRSAIPK